MAKSPEEMAASMIRNMPEKTGKSLTEWIDIARASGLEKHGQILKMLKADHGMTHGFANLVAIKTLQTGEAPSEDDLVATQYAGAKESLRTIYAQLPEDWQLFTEHKPYEPSFYSTVVQDWGSSLLLAQALGDKASCLVDLGHHLPNTNVEMVVARLITAGKLGGFHFNDSMYGDDDLTVALPK